MTMVLREKHVRKWLIIIVNWYYDSFGVINLYVAKPSYCTDFTTCLRYVKDAPQGIIH